MPNTDLRGYSPQDLYELYRNGYTSTFFDPEHLDELLASLPHPYFGDAAPYLYGSGKGKVSAPYKCALEFDPRAYEEKQVTGDCVSHGTRNACDISRASHILVGGAPFGWEGRGATEVIYGLRGFAGEGMHCSGAAEIVHKKAGIILRKKYSGADLSKYAGMLGAGWGGKGGPPRDLIQEASKHRVGTISAITSVEEAMAALANGYGIALCCQYGFSNKRDSKGFAAREGTWGHCMAWTACDDTGSEPAFLVQNSWGKWNDGGHPEWGPIPEGSFLIHADVANGMIRSGEAFAFSDVEGFPAQELPDWGTTSYL